MKYRVKLEKTDEGYAIWCPGLPGCWSQGTTEEEALENTKDAIETYLATVEELAKDRFTLFTVECLDSCGTAPMMQGDETYYENLIEEKAGRILAELELGTGDWWKNRGLTTG